MQVEIEAKFLNMDFDEIRTKLQKLGATCEQPMRIMRRAIFRTPAMTQDGRDDFMRVRDEGNKITMTYKSFKEQSIIGMHEIEIIVDDFAKSCELLLQTGAVKTSFQESRRETWRIENVEIVLDEWPHLNPYIEIESDSESAVKDVATKLQLNWQDAIFGGVTYAYQAQYPNGKAQELINIPQLSFSEPLPQIIVGN